VSAQLSIFDAYTGRSDPPRARRDDPSTSQLAAAQAVKLAQDHHAKIKGALEKRDGTIYELAAATGLTHVQVARRMPELQAAGDIAVVATETRASPSGRQCRVWRRAR
jgi:predicted ArsR family transcriptional regulator